MKNKSERAHRRAISYSVSYWVGLISMLLAPVTLRAQVTAATLTGQVIDPTGAVIPGAQVLLTNAATGLRIAATSNSAGLYSFRLLPPGNYNARVTKAGFRATVTTNILLLVNQATTVNFRMQLGRVTQAVTVKAAAALMQTSTSEIGTVVGQRKVNDLPLNGRQFTDLILLTPGVSSVNVSQNSGSGAPHIGAGAEIPSIGGAENRSNLFLMDGVYDSEPFFAAYTISPSIDTIQEFKVQSQNDLAEFGQTTGGTINLITKSGTNRLHGDAYEFVRNTAFDARNYFAPTVPAFRQNQFGVTVGGPVIIPHIYHGQDKTFFFFGYEGFRYSLASTSLTIVPTAAERNGDFSGQTPIFNPFTTPRTPFLNNQIPSTLFDKGIQAYLKADVPLPNLPNTPSGNFLNTEPNTTTQGTYMVRIDQNWGTHDNLFGRVSWAPTNVISPSELPANNGFTTFTGSTNAALNWNHIFSPTLIFHGLAGYDRSGYVAGSGNPYACSLLTVGFSQGFPRGIGGQTNCVVPQLLVTGGFDTTENNINAQGPQNNFTFRADVTKILGRHTFKAGFGLDTSLTFVSGNYPNESYDNLPTADLSDPSATGLPIASLLLGLPSGAFTYTGSNTQYLHTKLWNGYVQDQMKVTPKLDVNVGLRYDYRTPTTEEFGRFDSFDPYTGLYLMATIPPQCPNQSIFCLPGPLPAGVAKTRYSFVNPQDNDIQPRLGIAYNVKQNTVVRAGFGISYDMWSGVFQDANNGMGNWPAGAVESLSSINSELGTPGAPAPLFAEDPFVGLVVGNTIPATPFPLSGFSLNRFLKSPYVDDFNAEVEQRLSNSLTLTVGYVGSVTHHAPNEIYYNVAREPGAGAIDPRRPFPTEGFMYMDNNDNTAEYDSLQVELNKQFGHGLTFIGSYTWSKSIDRGCSGWFGVEGCERQFQFNSYGDRSVSTYDVPQIFVYSFVYQIPLGAGHKYFSSGLSSNVLGGWEINGITTFDSGPPFTVTDGFDNANVGEGGGHERPNLIGNPSGPHTVQEWFNTSAFAVSPPYTFGDAGRNILRSDGTQNLDFSLFKNFHLPLTESTRAQFRAEFFNIFNHPIFGVPGSTIDTPTFGVVTSASAAREIQFALKIYF